MEGKGRQQEVGEATGSRFDALEPKRRRRRPGDDALDPGTAVDERLQVTLPVRQVLDLVENQDPGAVGIFACAANLVSGFVDREPGIQRMVKRDIADVPAIVLAAGQQAGDDMVKQHGLSDAPRSHEDHGAVHAGLLHETREALEVRTRVQRAIVGTDLPTTPPGVLRAHAHAPLFRGDLTHGARLAASDSIVN